MRNSYQRFAATVALSTLALVGAAAVSANAAQAAPA
jgi:hypothetical protein